MRSLPGAAECKEASLIGSGPVLLCPLGPLGGRTPGGQSSTGCGSLTALRAGCRLSKPRERVAALGAASCRRSPPREDARSEEQRGGGPEEERDGPERKNASRFRRGPTHASPSAPPPLLSIDVPRNPAGLHKSWLKAKAARLHFQVPNFFIRVGKRHLPPPRRHPHPRHDHTEGEERPAYGSSLRSYARWWLRLLHTVVAGFVSARPHSGHGAPSASPASE